MEDKHIFTTSPWQKFLDSVKSFRQKMSEHARSKAKTVKPRPALVPKEQPKREAPPKKEVPVVKVEKKKEEEKTFKKQGFRIKSEESAKLLTVSLLFSVLAIMVLGIVLSYSFTPPGQGESVPPVVQRAPSPKTSPKPAAQSDPTADWTIFTSPGSRFEFKYPNTWSFNQNLMQIADPSNSLILTITSIEPGKIEGSYCRQNPSDFSRCESLTLGNSSVTINWGHGPTGPFSADILPPEQEFGLNVSMTLNSDFPKEETRSTDESRKLLRLILSTFKFR